MGFWKKLSEFLGYGNKYEDEIEAVSGEVDEEKTEKEIKRKEAKDKTDKIVNLANTKQLEVVLIKPEVYEDVKGVADQLSSGRTVVLNLESTDDRVIRRILDFLSGVTYISKGQIRRVANATFIVTPYNVGLVGDLLDELESSGVFFT